MTREADQELLEQATEFADELNSTVAGVLTLEDQPTFQASIQPGGTKAHLLVVPILPDDRDETHQPFRLEARGEHTSEVVQLSVEFRCCWDVTGGYLTIEWSEMRLKLQGANTPLMRLDYVRNLKRGNGLPAAHWQVHAHRDEIGYLLQLADRGRPRGRYRSGNLPRISDVHLPVGGDRYRPCLEDVLQLAIVEFGVEAADGWKNHLAAGRASWRRKQLAAAVRDAPEVAARVLTDEGWTVTPPTSGPRPERTHRLGDI